MTSILKSYSAGVEGETTQETSYKDTQTHTAEAKWVELFSSCGLRSFISPFISGS